MATPPLSVKVFILQSQNTSVKADIVANLFSYLSTSDLSVGPEAKLIFSVEIAPIDLSAGSEPDKAEFNAVKTALATVVDPNSYVIFCLDTSISAASPETIYLELKEAANINLNGTHLWDLCYLCRWMDNCTLYRDVVPSIPDLNSKIVETFSPYGFQGVMFSPFGVEKFKALLTAIGTPTKSLSLVLHDQRAVGGWSAISFLPNLVEFDAMMARPGSMDYIRNTACRDPVPAPVPSSNSNMSFFWFIVVLVAVIILTYLIIVGGPWLRAKLADMSVGTANTGVASGIPTGAIAASDISIGTTSITASSIGTGAPATVSS